METWTLADELQVIRMLARPDACVRYARALQRRETHGVNFAGTRPFPARVARTCIEACRLRYNALQGEPS